MACTELAKDTQRSWRPVAGSIFGFPNPFTVLLLNRVPHLKSILRPTLGIFLHQNKVLLGVSALIDSTAGEADLFRLAMGNLRSREAMARLRP